jgi:predicted DNA-binding transcriptional regulator AlpA
MPDGFILPGWPRALREELAAAYVGLSPASFRRDVVPEVPPIKLTTRCVGWLREDLDAWLDRRAGRVQASAPAGRAPPRTAADEWDEVLSDGAG